MYEEKCDKEEKKVKKKKDKRVKRVGSLIRKKYIDEMKKFLKEIRGKI